MTKTPGRRFLAVTAASSLLFAAGLARNRASPPLPSNAPSDAFSASRALARLRTILAGGAPHPEGSPANAEVESRIVGELAAMGYSPSIQEEFVCGAYGTCGTVRNILARLPGREEHGSVLLSAHFDSVEAGPGASDDGLGVASALEIASILRSGPARRRPVVFLIDDGEEQGLLGAEAFAARHPWARDVSADVNLEARGTSGASLLFETSDDNQWLVEAAKKLPHPVSSSVFPTIYRMLPNDTDLTVFKRHGMAGVNFGCIGDVSRYHTPLDDLAHVSLSTLQHQGENALAMVESLSSRPLSPPAPGNAVFFDLLGSRIVSWPESGTLPLAALAIALLAAGGFSGFRSGALRLRACARAFAFFWGMIGIPALVAVAARKTLGAGGILPGSWTHHPAVPLAGLWLLVLAVVWGVALAAARGSSPAELSAGIWTGWAVLGAVAAVAVPGMSFLLLLPLLAAAGPPGALDPESRAGLLAAPLAALLWLPMDWRLGDALGFDGIAVIAVVVALPATALVPAAARLASPQRRALLAALAATTAALLLASVGIEPFSPDSPRRLTIFWHEDADTGRARWLVEGSPAPGTAILPFPWSTLRAEEAPAPSESVAAPEFVLEEKSAATGGVRFRGRILSPRGAAFARIAFPPGVRVGTLRIAGVAVAPLSGRALGRSRGWKVYSCVTLPRDGVEIEGELAGEPAEFILMDRTPGIPASGRPLLAARPASAVPSQTGDASWVTRRVRL